MTKKERARIKARIKNIENEIVELESSKSSTQNDEDILFDKEHTMNLILMNKSFVNALKWVLGE